MTPSPQASRQRLSKRVVQVSIDALMCALSLVAAYWLRFDGAVPPLFVDQLVVLLPAVVMVRLLSYAAFGVYRVVWAYVGVREALLFVRAVAGVSLLLLAGRLFVRQHEVIKVPISIIFLEGTLTFLGLVGSRFLRRVLHERKRGAVAKTDDRIRTILAGAGQGGLSISKEALRHPELGIRVVGFVDDDEFKQGMEINGARVLGGMADVRDVVKLANAQQVIVTSEAISSKAIVAMIDALRPIDVRVRIVPGLYEMLGPQLRSQALRDVRIEDLLSRDPVPPSLSIEDIKARYSGKRVLVTGAGGSIGSELCRQLKAVEPKTLILLERDENALFEIERELAGAGLSDVLVPALGDISDARGMDQLFRTHEPQMIFHAAAFKHVPVMEQFPWAAVRNNVHGTKLMAELAEKHGVESFVMISTDKAVRPTSVMGATKRLAEVIVQELGERSKTHFSCVRFGNVLGSRGSVIPIFRRQISAGGPITVTHPDATRYFMTIPEAANLVLQAATLGSTGEIFLLDMGTPVRIMDLARQMIHLSGATEEQIPIKIVGTRPGEKLFEELRADGEDISDTELRKVYRVQPESFDQHHVSSILERLDFVARTQDSGAVREALVDLGIGYTPEPAKASDSN